MRSREFGPPGAPGVPIIGQGTWQFPRNGAAVERAIAALRAGVEHGMTHIDTAEMYTGAEEVVARAIAGMPRASLFIVSKVLPSNASAAATVRACDASLRRLKLEYLDCYLLHWRGRVPLEETIGALEGLADAGKIRSLGVSNFDVDDLREAQTALRRHRIACNQVQYNLVSRGIEHHVIPYCRDNGIAVVGYSPLGAGDFPGDRSRGGRVLAEIGKRYGKTARQTALAFLTRLDATFTIPKSANVEHTVENAGGDFTLTEDDVRAIDAAFPLPGPDEPLAVS